MSGPGTPGLVSIVIPTYNRDAYLGATLTSALAQTYRQFEVIVVDDGSTDRTRDVVAGFHDPRIRYHFKENSGLSSTRNHGLAAAGGEFIAFLDSDDLWHPWKLDAQVELLRRHAEVGMTWSDFTTMNHAGVVLGERQLRRLYAAYQKVEIERVCSRQGTLGELSDHPPPDVRSSPYYVCNIGTEMFLGNFVHPPTAMVRRERLRKSGPFQPEVTGNGGDDYHFYYRICQAGAVALLDAPTMLYRLHPQQMTTQHPLNEARADVRIVTHWLKHQPPALPRGVVDSRLASAHAWAGYEELQAGNRRVAATHLWRSLRLGGYRTRPVLLLLASVLPNAALSLFRLTKRVLSRFGVSRRRG